MPTGYKYTATRTTGKITSRQWYQVFGGARLEAAGELRQSCVKPSHQGSHKEIMVA